MRWQNLTTDADESRRLPGYRGTYIYSDYCTALVRSFRLENGRAIDARDWQGE